MTVRRTAGLLGVAAAVLVVVGAFLPMFQAEPRFGPELEFRLVDLNRPVGQWLASLIAVSLTAVLFAGSGLAIATGRRMLLAAGVLLGVGLVEAAGLLPVGDSQFSRGSGAWLSAAGYLLAVVAGVLGLISQPTGEEDSPPSDRLPGSTIP